MTVEGQVCDRCRQKKVKCDGASDRNDSCSNCTAAGTPCEVSARLRRKTKFRGYAGRNEAQSMIEKLQRENDQLRQQVQPSTERSPVPRQQNDRVDNQVTTSTTSAMPRMSSEAMVSSTRKPSTSFSQRSEASTSRRSAACVIKHMGRMVHDHANVGRFAGSTTGVHFVASVEELCRRSRPHLKPFPESCFRMFFLESSISTDQGDFLTAFGTNRQPVLALLDRPRDYFLSKLDAFNDTWITFCPLIPRAMFATDVDHALNSVRVGARVDHRGLCTLGMMLTILLITELETGRDPGGWSQSSLAQQCLTFIHELHLQTTARGDLSSLQTLILLTFYYQITNQTSHFVGMNGVLVRLAQSLGMHRHARRFRMNESEIEFRKRMWWWVYCFDQYTSLIHGLPRLIQDTDDDNDLPIDCELDDLGPTGLSHPLPGEPTPVFIYLRFIQLSKIISMILGLLYTTTQRREGEERIVNLDRELRGWSQNLNSALRLSSSLENVDKPLPNSRLQRFLDTEKLMIAWLDLMANYALVLIHRPALTFDQSTSRFRESLNVAVKASATILWLSSSSSFHRKALECAPFGPALVFQSALMQIFNSCLGEFGALSTDTALAQKTVREAIRLLQEMLERSNADLISQKKLLGNAVSLLNTLSAEFLGSETPTRDSNLFPPALSTLGQDGTEVAGQTTTWMSPPPFTEDVQGDLDYWNTSALESLNHLDMFVPDWDGVDIFGPHVS